ncbi:sulfite exporter TauE/SafE family protein [Actinobacillus genomosp. 2]|uniref:sulfite exporter TauE/SafE family protein n=1 Tax=Actinobacillus genomosp. 2 TaxID=230709 RepID=UPI0024435CA9|nr:sulfite exporter TauE/SafE family protein [Actinobacillus genomosp. 2]WGE31467.1 sulfite exporter TauE/SafE family protein [Actinobacillus genomosp. 2]
MIEVFLSCLVLGTVVGFLAGLFGIGGGLIIVPSLVYLFPMAGVTPENLMAAALGTSFSTIVVTAFSSAQRHHKLGNVDVQVSKYFIPALMASVFLAGLVVSNLDAKLMSKIFAVMVVYLAARMLFSLKKTPEIKPLTTQSTIVAGGVIGALSSMAGIAGGAFIVPFLNSRGVEMKRAIGTSSFCGAFLGLSGTISFITSGWHVEMPDYSLGYVYLPALFGITLTSYFTSKLGANAANVLPVATLKKAFAVLLVVIAINMFLK